MIKKVVSENEKVLQSKNKLTIVEKMTSEM